MKKGPGQAPGKYQVTIFINNNKIDTRDVTFILQKQDNGENSLQPCFTLSDLKSLGIKTDDYPQLAVKGACADLHAIPAATATFRVSNQQLLLSIPQSALGQVPRGYIDPTEFDEGSRRASSTTAPAPARATPVSRACRTTAASTLTCVRA